MDEMDPMLLVVGQTYPRVLPSAQGAIADFLQVQGNTLMVAIDDLTAEEVAVLRRGTLRAGLLCDGSEILLLFEFTGPRQRPRFVFDCPFDARRIPLHLRELVDLPNTTYRLVITLHIVDRASGILRGLRQVTLSPATSRRFLGAVQDQLASADLSDRARQRWHKQDPEALLLRADAQPCGQTENPAEILGSSPNTRA